MKTRQEPDIDLEYNALNYVSLWASAHSKLRGLFFVNDHRPAHRSRFRELTCHSVVFHHLFQCNRWLEQKLLFIWRDNYLTIFI